jgi:hypothetical protein
MYCMYEGVRYIHIQKVHVCVYFYPQVHMLVRVCMDYMTNYMHDMHYMKKSNMQNMPKKVKNMHEMQSHMQNYCQSMQHCVAAVAYRTLQPTCKCAKL